MKRYSVRFYISRKGNGIPVGGSINRITGEVHTYYNATKQITYKGDTVMETLQKAIGYVGGYKKNIITSYTVTDRVKNTRMNVRLGTA